MRLICMDIVRGRAWICFPDISCLSA